MHDLTLAACQRFCIIEEINIPGGHAVSNIRSTVSQCPGLQSLPTTTASSARSSSASVIPPVPVSPSRAARNSGVSSRSTPRDIETSKLKTSFQGSSNGTSALALLTTILGRTTLGTWARASSSSPISSSNPVAASPSQSYSQLHTT